jgi:hypothetical protein
MTRQKEDVESLARDMGRLRDRMLKIALRNKQTAKNQPATPAKAPPKKPAKPAPAKAPPPKKPAAQGKRAVPAHLKPYLFQRQKKG